MEITVKPKFDLSNFNHKTVFVLFSYKIQNIPRQVVYKNKLLGRLQKCQVSHLHLILTSMHLSHSMIGINVLIDWSLIGPLPT